jgi:hypothetical protein
MRQRIAKPVTLGLGIALLAMGVRTIVGFLPSRVNGNDFAMGYVAGRLIDLGRDVYEVKSLNEPSAELGLPFRDKMGQATNPPLLLWVFEWLSRLEPATAFWFWTALEALSLVFVLVACWRLIGGRLAAHEWVLATGLTVCSLPVFANFWFGQVQLPLAALIMAGLWLSRFAVANLPLTLAAALKLFPWPLVMFPALGRRGRARYRQIGWAAALLVVWAALPGWRMWRGFFQHAATVFNDMASGRYFNYTITSFVSTIVGPETGRVIGTILSLVIFVMAWVWSDQALRRGTAEAEESSACLLLVAMLMGSLVCWMHYLVLLVYPLIFLAAQRRTSTRILVVAGLLSVNIAGTNPLAGWPQPLKLIGANLPLLFMVALYVYFAGRLRGRYT